MEKASVVFSGTVQEILKEKHSSKETIVFQVDDSFKGQPKSEVETVDAMAGTDCATDFKYGDSYMVFGRWEWGVIQVSSCTGTSFINPLDEANRYSGTSELLKDKIYKDLRENCLGLPITMCCLASVKSMSQGRYLPMQSQGCPEGMVPDRLKCTGSHIWCIPADGSVKDHRHSK